MSAAVAEIEALRCAHADLLRRHESVVALHSDLEQNYKRAEQSKQGLAESNAILERENAALRAERKALLQRLYGKRSEKLDGMQHELFEEARGELDAEARERELAATGTEPVDPSKPKQRRKRGHGNLPTRARGR